jgi:hypothetical protein
VPGREVRKDQQFRVLPGGCYGAGEWPASEQRLEANSRRARSAAL